MPEHFATERLIKVELQAIERLCSSGVGRSTPQVDYSPFFDWFHWSLEIWSPLIKQPYKVGAPTPSQCNMRPADYYKINC